MATKDNKQPIVIKRARRHAHAHHGGAWKIAYADFVTAMMAFFLLMWLLGSTTKGELQGISDYFRTPLKVALTGGSGAGESPNVIQGGGKGFVDPQGALQKSSSPMEKHTPNTKASREATEREDAQRIAEVKKKVEAAIAASPSLKSYRNQVRLDVTSEGLRVQIVDNQSRPMFDLGSAAVKSYMRDILREIGAVLNTVEYKLTLSGHTDATPYIGGAKGYSNWELSADRANSSRRELVAGGMEEGKILRVLGVGPSVMLNRDDPYDATNRRISIIVMNKSTEARVRRDLGALDVKDAEELSDKLPESGTK